MATLTIKDTVAHDTQMRYSPSLLHSSERRSASHGGDAAAVSSANCYSSDASNLRTGARKSSGSHTFKTSCTVVPDSVKFNPGGVRRSSFGSIGVTFAMRSSTIRSTRFSVDCLRP